MRLPEELAAAIMARTSGPGLSRAAAELSETYRARNFAAPALKTADQRLAYLMVRMPATYAACLHVLNEASSRIDGLKPATLLDLGAGPGSATWAACEVFPSLSSLTLVERDAAMVALGRGLMEGSSRVALSKARWMNADLNSELSTEGADLVVLSYVVGELTDSGAERLIQRAWAATRQALVIIEPGTKAGFATVERIRAMMIAAGVEIAAPCPHRKQCPMAEAGDWCHFSQRLERTAEHRRLKHGDLGHEDEKFSYIVLSKVEVRLPDARIVRHPLYRPKRIELTLCTAEGLQQTVVTKSQGERYRAAKKADWGDAFQR